MNRQNKKVKNGKIGGERRRKYWRARRVEGEKKGSYFEEKIKGPKRIKDERGGEGGAKDARPPREGKALEMKKRSFTNRRFPDQVGKKKKKVKTLHKTAATKRKTAGREKTWRHANCKGPKC